MSRLLLERGQEVAPFFYSLTCLLVNISSHVYSIFFSTCENVGQLFCMQEIKLNLVIMHKKTQYEYIINTLFS